MKNKIFTILLASLMVATAVSMSGCGGSEEGGTAANGSQDKTYTTAATTKDPNRFYPEVSFAASDEDYVVELKTNFPVGTVFNITLAMPSAEFSAEQTATVEEVDGVKMIVSKPFAKDDGSAIEQGKYRFKYRMDNAAKQPTDVQKIIGVSGDKLDGADVFAENNASFYMSSMTLELEDGIFSRPQ